MKQFLHCSLNKEFSTFLKVMLFCWAKERGAQKQALKISPAWEKNIVFWGKKGGKSDSIVSKIYLDRIFFYYQL